MAAYYDENGDYDGPDDDPGDEGLWEDRYEERNYGDMVRGGYDR